MKRLKGLGHEIDFEKFVRNRADLVLKKGSIRFSKIYNLCPKT